jgi:hypothetical protein
MKGVTMKEKQKETTIPMNQRYCINCGNLIGTFKPYCFHHLMDSYRGNYCKNWKEYTEYNKKEK